MGHDRTTRSRPPLKLRKQSLRVLIPDELELVAGGVNLDHLDMHGRGPSRRCFTGGA